LRCFPILTCSLSLTLSLTLSQVKKAECLYNLGEHDACVATCTALLVDGGTGSNYIAAATYIRGVEYYAIGELDLAAEDLGEAHRLSPDHVTIHQAYKKVRPPCTGITFDASRTRRGPGGSELTRSFRDADFLLPIVARGEGFTHDANVWDLYLKGRSPSASMPNVWDLYLKGRSPSASMPNPCRPIRN
jgi:tetratricopeptide (TPR) repeat protein